MDKKWLEAQFALHPEKKKADLARALNLEAPAISKVLAGGREIKAKEYILMRKFFGMPSDGKSALGVSAGAYVIKPLGEKIADDGMHDGGFSSKNDWVIPANLMREKTSANAKQIRTFKVEEDAMSPDFKAGEYVLVDVSSIKPSPPGVFLVSDGMGEIIRQCEYIPQSTPSSVKLTAKKKGYDPVVLELKDSTVIGRIIAKIEWV